MDEVDALWRFVPLFAARYQLLQQRLDHPCQQRHALHQPVLGSVPDQRVLVVEEVQHAEEADLVQLHELLMDIQQVFVLVASQPPEMRKTLDGGFLVRRTVRVEGPFDGFSELEGEILAKADDEIDDLGVHVRVIKQRPQFLKG